MLVSNKVDTSIRENDSFEFYELGLADQIHSISANNGYGTGEFLDALIEQLPKVPVVEDDETPRLAVVGRPNVGKSTFVNTLLGQERNIVTDIAGTTRDAIDTRFNAFGFDLIITDTQLVCARRSKSKISWSSTAPCVPSTPLSVQISVSC